MAKKMISLEIPDALRESLRLAAYKENKSISALIRDTLIKEFGGGNQPPKETINGTMNNE